ncbi:hypothetical protein PPERSA_04544 [Pseudocohnilembus persalinus]|uniref:Uncharacterized protein n=1 Tax=Pseudocohnilembus persalinus TaxID=266149 RepID=A0A0V0QEF3_PSEPJ|nr:hypothetical protein PPERSA_04544 [Pseudocohnilembus persalinus]|eukprot:KRX00523.1 hypothetical protein PPERSA_04544 [Pseudocohnilembus persalinus]
MEIWQKISEILLDTDVLTLNKLYGKQKKQIENQSSFLKKIKSNKIYFSNARDLKKIDPNVIFSLSSIENFEFEISTQIYIEIKDYNYKLTIKNENLTNFDKIIGPLFQREDWKKIKNITFELDNIELMNEISSILKIYDNPLKNIENLYLNISYGYQTNLDEQMWFDFIDNLQNVKNLIINSNWSFQLKYIETNSLSLKVENPEKISFALQTIMLPFYQIKYFNTQIKNINYFLQCQAYVHTKKTMTKKEKLYLKKLEKKNNQQGRDNFLFLQDMNQNQSKIFKININGLQLSKFINLETASFKFNAKTFLFSKNRIIRLTQGNWNQIIDTYKNIQNLKSLELNLKDFQFTKPHHINRINNIIQNINPNLESLQINLQNENCISDENLTQFVQFLSDKLGSSLKKLWINLYFGKKLQTINNQLQNLLQKFNLKQLTLDFKNCSELQLRQIEGAFNQSYQNQNFQNIQDIKILLRNNQIEQEQQLNRFSQFKQQISEKTQENSNQKIQFYFNFFLNELKHDDIQIVDLYTNKVSKNSQFTHLSNIDIFIDQQIQYHFQFKIKKLNTKSSFLVGLVQQQFCQKEHYYIDIHNKNSQDFKNLIYSFAGVFQDLEKGELKQINFDDKINLNLKKQDELINELKNIEQKQKEIKEETNRSNFHKLLDIDSIFKNNQVQKNEENKAFEQKNQELIKKSENIKKQIQINKANGIQEGYIIEVLCYGGKQSQYSVDFNIYNEKQEKQTSFNVSINNQKLFLVPLIGIKNSGEINQSTEVEFLIDQYKSGNNILPKQERQNVQ